ncbi:Ion transport protein-domain-containing protein [Lipomyces oligophaga]|uniref:Ion transport protein-domain-containing protein n=1 Tax=Lipomyces oligophaga TaxID=45792 RepID=UPI0034CDA1FB
MGSVHRVVGIDSVKLSVHDRGIGHGVFVSEVEITETPPSDENVYINESPTLPQVDYVRSKLADPEIIEKFDDLRGNSLGFIGSTSLIRKFLLRLELSSTLEIFMFFLLVLQSFVVIFRASHEELYNNDSSSYQELWASEWSNIILVPIFACYTLESVVKIIVSGFILNPDHSFQELISKFFQFFHINNNESHVRIEKLLASKISSLYYSSALTPPPITEHNINSSTEKISRLAYLRSSWNRLDFVSVLCYWVYLALVLVDTRFSDAAVNLFRMLSTIRLLRWLKITNGTKRVLDSIKQAVPFLVNVSLFISAFWTIFAIIGVQAFRGSLRRQCVWINPENSEDTFQNMQFCGGYINSTTLEVEPFLKLNGQPSQRSPKGYICPIYSQCIESDANPYSDTVSFDNIARSWELLFITMGMNGFSDLMSYTQDSDTALSALFFVVAVVILSWWLFNLFIAVISESFGRIREYEEQLETPTKSRTKADLTAHRLKISRFRRYYIVLQPYVVLLIVCDFIIQSVKSVNMSTVRTDFINVSEVVITFVLLGEIIFRFLILLPHFRIFFADWRNDIDLLLAFITTLSLFVGRYGNDKVYPWLSFFQVVRIYRFILQVRVMREHWITLTKKTRDFFNMTLFFLLVVFLVSLFGSELLRGYIPDEYEGETQTITFETFPNAFAGVYQVLTTEGWAPMLYSISGSISNDALSWFAVFFLCGWFMFSNAVVVNIFIAVVQSNFDISDEEQRRLQVLDYAKRFTINKDLRPGDVDYSRRPSLAPRKGSLAPQRFDSVLRGRDNELMDFNPPSLEYRYSFGGVEDANTKLSFAYWKDRLFGQRKKNPFYYETAFEFAETANLRTILDKAVEAKTKHLYEREVYLSEHPNFTRSCMFFKEDNPIRKLCAWIAPVPREDGVRDNNFFFYFLMVMVLAMVIVSSIYTPQKEIEYFEKHCNWSEDQVPCTKYTPMTIANLIFAQIFTIEAIIRIISYGFVYTPHAYLRDVWNRIDFVVLISMWVDNIIALTGSSGSARWLRSLKALRALRLLHVMPDAQETFQNVIFSGIGRILVAAMISLSLLLPFALWGLNIFRGKFYSCADGSIEVLDHCLGEFSCLGGDSGTCAPYNWDIWLPRSYNTPGFSFDSFPEAVSVLFQIISLEGWNDVLQAAKNVVGTGMSSEYNHSVYNAIYVYLFNALSILFISTLFITAVMQNYATRTGAAYLTSKQHSLLEMFRVLKAVRPSRTDKPPSSRWRKKCFELAVTQGNKLRLAMRIALLVLLGLLLSESYQSNYSSPFRNVMYAIVSICFTLNAFIRIFGLRWRRKQTRIIDFNTISRNAYDILWACVGTFTTTICILVLISDSHELMATVAKIMMTFLLLYLISMSDQLSQLFIAARASLLSITGLLFTWGTLFMVYAIACNQIFGLTRLGENSSANLNFRSVPKALLLLFRMSCGEGWNSIMQDYLVEAPFCIDSGNFYTSDCGSSVYAYILFFTWNILSMYIFMNVFISLVIENFNYVHQQSEFRPFFTRDAIRAYKRAWSRVDVDGSDYIPRERLGQLLRCLPQPYQCCIYDENLTYWQITEDAAVSAIANPTGRLVGPASRLVDLDRLNEIIDGLDVGRVRSRRTIITKLYTEILDTFVEGKGIPFSAPLSIIPFYKIQHEDFTSLP